MKNEISEKEIKTGRLMELFIRALKGEALSVKELSEEYGVSTRSITRDINDLKAFLSDHQDILGYAELQYSGNDHSYTLIMDSFLSNKELLSITKVLIGCRVFSNQDLLEIIKKLKSHTTPADRKRLEKIIQKEIYHYNEVKSDTHSLIDNIWTLTDCIERRNEISITYYKMNRAQVKRRIKPVSILFSEYYFYMIAYKCDTDTPNTPFYFRIDRITDIVVHREKFTLSKEQNVDEGLLRQKSQFMWPGKSRRIRFEFTGPSVQAILDRIPTAKIVDSQPGKSIIEAEVFGTGIKMFLLSQGAGVKVLAPAEFVDEISDEIRKMQSMY